MNVLSGRGCAEAAADRLARKVRIAPRIIREELNEYPSQ